MQARFDSPFLAHSILLCPHSFLHLASGFGIDVLAFAILSNHVHLILRQRPDVVATWDDTEVARRWWWLCPKRKSPDGRPAEASEADLNSIRTDPDKPEQHWDTAAWVAEEFCRNVAMGSLHFERNEDRGNAGWGGTFFNLG